MRIAIDTLHIIRGKSGSHEPYLRNLVQAIARLDDANEYFLLGTKPNAGYLGVEGDNFKKIVFPDFLESRPLRIAWEQLVVPFVLLKHRIDLVHFPGNTGTMFAPCKHVVTLHIDLYPDQARSVHWIKLLYYQVMLRLTSARADRLVLVSHSLEPYANEELKIPKECMRVVYHGVHLAFGSSGSVEAVEAVKRKYGISGPYILTVTNPQRLKNLDRQLHAYANLRAKRAVCHKLVLVGPLGRQRIRESLVQAGGEAWADDVICTGHLPHDELPPLYGGASLFVTVSLSETFGIPLIEAMAAGVPVLASDIPPFREVLGDVGFMVNPLDVEDIEAGVVRLLPD